MMDYDQRQLVMIRSETPGDLEATLMRSLLPRLSEIAPYCPIRHVPCLLIGSSDRP